MTDDGVVISVPLLGIYTVALPLFAFVFCLLWSIVVDFEKATYTHCEVPQFAPSISSIIGGFNPQSHIWKVSIALVSTPGFLFARIYYKYFRDRLSSASRTQRLVYFNFVLNVVENISLIGLSFVPSSEVFIIHESFFITFLASSIISMCITVFYFYHHCGFQPKSFEERSSIRYKQLLTKVTLISAALAFYFYWRHNEFCEPYVYSFFSLCEYIVVLCNIATHGLIFFDFNDTLLTTIHIALTLPLK